MDIKEKRFVLEIVFFCLIGGIIKEGWVDCSIRGSFYWKCVYCCWMWRIVGLVGLECWYSYILCGRNGVRSRKSVNRDCCY